MDTHNNPYAPPLATLTADESRRIEALAVCATWKRRFLAIAAVDRTCLCSRACPPLPDRGCGLSGTAGGCAHGIGIGSGERGALAISAWQVVLLLWLGWLW
ncbi:hypothetical protein [Stutzerimonas stutzeri]|uniref:Uncharacterized protein n=1 Tax=Stutzerimonas stutzeri KOS6 TaxID=1218352 RepID=A0A061JUH6_STUST|nr:hypothetical protein [Stutzerimonas stutzeri]EWC43371.1 hypothetical protein B597_001185 [Stutzerimonas stutzeri KOS6]